jgi:hypothetical protein
VCLSPRLCHVYDLCSSLANGYNKHLRPRIAVALNIPGFTSWQAGGERGVKVKNSYAPRCEEAARNDVIAGLLVDHHTLRKEPSRATKPCSSRYLPTCIKTWRPPPPPRATTRIISLCMCSNFPSIGRRNRPGCSAVRFGSRPHTLSPVRPTVLEKFQTH